MCGWITWRARITRAIRRRTSAPGTSRSPPGFAGRQGRECTGDLVAVLPEAGPALGDDNAVAGVARVVAKLNGLVDAEAEDLVGQEADVLCAVVGDACEAVAVDEHVGGWGDAVVAGDGAGVEDEAVGDAAVEGKVLAATALDLFGRGAAQADDEIDERRDKDNSSGDAAEEARVAVVQLSRKTLEKRLQGSSQG
jgi:hypothetical protein